MAGQLRIEFFYLVSALLARVLMGEEIVISKAGEPIAVIHPYRGKGRGKGRKPGLFEGQVTMSDDFCAPMDESFLKLFQNKNLLFGLGSVPP